MSVKTEAIKGSLKAFRKLLEKVKDKSKKSKGKNNTKNGKPGSSGFLSGTAGALGALGGAGFLIKDLIKSVLKSSNKDDKNISTEIKDVENDLKNIPNIVNKKTTPPILKNLTDNLPRLYNNNNLLELNEVPQDRSKSLRDLINPIIERVNVLEKQQKNIHLYLTKLDNNLNSIEKIEKINYEEQKRDEKEEKIEGKSSFTKPIVKFFKATAKKSKSFLSKYGVILAGLTALTASNVEADEEIPNDQVDDDTFIDKILNAFTDENIEETTENIIMPGSIGVAAGAVASNVNKMNSTVKSRKSRRKKPANKINWSRKWNKLKIRLKGFADYIKRATRIKALAYSGLKWVVLAAEIYTFIKQIDDINKKYEYGSNEWHDEFKIVIKNFLAKVGIPFIIGLVVTILFSLTGPIAFLTGAAAAIATVTVIDLLPSFIKDGSGMIFDAYYDLFVLGSFSGFRKIYNAVWDKIKDSISSIVDTNNVGSIKTNIEVAQKYTGMSNIEVLNEADNLIFDDKGAIRNVLLQTNSEEEYNQLSNKFETKYNKTLDDHLKDTLGWEETLNFKQVLEEHWQLKENQSYDNIENEINNIDQLIIEKENTIKELPAFEAGSYQKDIKRLKIRRELLLKHNIINAKEEQTNGQLTRQKVINYLVNEKDINPIHAMGMVLNMEQESTLDPAAKSKHADNVEGEQALGLFQYSYKPRRDAFLKAVPNWETDWKGQIDFALSENEAKKYLNRNITNIQDAHRYFLEDFEKPAKEQAEARILEVSNMDIKIPEIANYTPTKSQDEKLVSLIQPLIQNIQQPNIPNRQLNEHSRANDISTSGMYSAKDFVPSSAIT